MSADYNAILANLDENVARTAAHLDELLDDYEQTMQRLRSHVPGDIPHDISAAVRCLESLAAETLQLVVLLNHRGGDHVAARRAIDRLRRLEEITVKELRPK